LLHFLHSNKYGILYLSSKLNNRFMLEKVVHVLSHVEYINHINHVIF